MLTWRKLTPELMNYSRAVLLFAWLRIHDMDEGRNILRDWCDDDNLYNLYMGWLDVYLGGSSS